MEDNRPLGEIFGGTLLPAKRLADQEGARVKDARAAMTDAGQDVEKARQLLKQRDQIMTPEKRRAERARQIKKLEESKPGWRQMYRQLCQQKLTEVDEEIAKLKEEQRTDV